MAWSTSIYGPANSDVTNLVPGEVLEIVNVIMNGAQVMFLAWLTARVKPVATNGR
jgi:hypothetical protein